MPVPIAAHDLGAFSSMMKDLFFEDGASFEAVMAHKAWKVSCGALDTGVPPSIVAQMICRGEIKQRGVLAPESCVPAQRFFEELAKRCMEMRKITDEVLAAANSPRKAVSV